MSIVEITNIKTALVVGPIYDKIEKLETIDNLNNKYDKIILMGSIFYTSKSNQDIEERLNLIKKYSKITYLISDLDLLAAYRNKNYYLKHIPNCAILKTNNKFPIIITSGGLQPNTKNLDNLELSFINYINNQPWHNLYNGNLGYIISNNPLSKNKPEYYNYSMQLGNYINNNTYAQEINENGLAQMVII